MRTKTTSLFLLLAVSFLLSSCLKNDEDTEQNYYSDTAIAGFSLGTLNRYLHTVGSDGQDSVYKESYVGAKYKFWIDQTAARVYNVDSLPYGTDTKHVLANITSINRGTILVKSTEDDTFTYYASTDSTDFSTPRTVRIVSQDGERYRDYTVTVNVKKSPEGVMGWQSPTTSSELAQLDDMRAVANGGRVFVFGSMSGRTVLYSTAETDGASWTATSTSFSAEACKSLVTKDGYLYLLDRGSVYRSTDGTSWVRTGGDASLSQLVAASRGRLYARTASGLKASSDNGASWTDEMLDNSASLLPTEQTGYICKTSKVNPGTDVVTLVGYQNGGSHAVAWTKYDDSTAGSNASGWTYVDPAGDFTFGLARYPKLSLASYGGGILALAFDGSQPLLRQSRDEGITWHAPGIELPESFAMTTTHSAMTTDSRGALWIVSDGQVWVNR